MAGGQEVERRTADTLERDKLRTELWYASEAIRNARYALPELLDQTTYMELLTARNWLALAINRFEQLKERTS